MSGSLVAEEEIGRMASVSSRLSPFNDFASKARSRLWRACNAGSVGDTGYLPRSRCARNDRSSSVRVQALLGAAWVGFALLGASPARAQALGSDRAPPPIQVSDRNGVDLKSGKLIRSRLKVAIGDAQEPSLSYAPLNLNVRGGNTPTDSNIRFHQCDNNAVIDEGCEHYYTVVLQDCEATFVPGASSGIVVGFEGDMLDLSNPSAFTVYATDGSKWEFSRLAPPPAWQHTVSLAGEIQRMTRRDGSTLVFEKGASGTYRTMVTSSDGYRLLVGTDTRLVNLAEQYCDRSASYVSSPASTHVSDNLLPSGVRVVTDAAGREHKRSRRFFQAQVQNID